MKYISTILICAGLWPVSTICAQKGAEKDSTLNRTVVVENQYNPEVMDAFKVNVMPEVEEPAAPKQAIQYATDRHPLGAWKATPMEAMSREWAQKGADRGYVRLAYGNLNNVDLKGSYLWDISSKDQLGVMASLYGRNGEIPHFLSPDDWKSRFYRTDVSLDYRHDFRSVALKLGGAFASQVFNYMPSLNEDVETWPTTQRYTLGEGYVGVVSRDKDLPIQFGLQTGLRSFSTRYDTYYMRHGSENIVHTEGFMAGNINDEQQVGVGLEMDNLIHDVSQQDYTLVQLTPYYTLQNEALRLRLGAHVDFQTANGSGLKAAPDVKLEYTFADSYVVYVNLLGGSRLNDFRRLNDFSPYWVVAQQMKTSYTPLDAKLGLKASPVTGLGFELYGGYRITKNELFAVPGGFVTDKQNVFYTGIWQDKGKVGYGGASVSYAYRDWVDFSLSGAYYNWTVTEGNEGLLQFKPQAKVDFGIRAKVVKDCHALLSYNYERRQKIGELGRANDVNNLSVGAEYELLNRFNVFARLNNLLNKTYATEAGYPVEGFHFMAGISCRF
ncbi:TonB-dependent receptor [Bacteroides mediterraneensis]|uniref:TonB-dependent receptor n=1 Tax=Bacteroides mediterraneensis TaxID=1841856 RepID=UPI0026EFF7D8|nr:TonB-dependent receptor [Bacteroides mediterraneensis]